MFYEYKVKYIPEYTSDGLTREECGLLDANSYREAAEKVSDVFQDTLIDMYLCGWDCDKLISIEDIKEGFNLTC